MPGSDLLHAAQPAHRCGEVAAAGDCSASLVIPGVSTGPGHSAQTRILRGASSIAQDVLNLYIDTGAGEVADRWRARARRWQYPQVGKAKARSERRGFRCTPSTFGCRGVV